MLGIQDRNNFNQRISASALARIQVDDFALVRLRTSATLIPGLVELALLPKISQAAESFEHQIATVMGMGIATSNDISFVIKYANFIVMTDASCREVYGSHVIASTFCARSADGSLQSACQGEIRTMSDSVE